MEVTIGYVEVLKIIICNKLHKNFYQTIIDFYLENQEKIIILQSKYAVGTDQPVLNFFVQKEKIKYKQLPYEWNMQDMRRFEVLTDDLKFIDIGWIYHFNSMPDDMRNYFMNKTRKTLCIT